MLIYFLRHHKKVAIYMLGNWVLLGDFDQRPIDRSTLNLYYKTLLRQHSF